MKNTELVDSLITGIQEADSMNSDYIFLRKYDAMKLLEILTGQHAEAVLGKGKEGKKLFFCSDCGKSFWEVPREDETCFAKYRYHTWYANCPLCRREVSQNDRYWR